MRIPGHSSAAPTVVINHSGGHVGAGQCAFAGGPQHFFYDDGLTAAAVNAAHAIHQKNQESPERNELETPLGEIIVSRPRLMAARTNRLRTFARTHGDFDAPVIGSEPGLMVDEAGKAVATI